MSVIDLHGWIAQSPRMITHNDILAEMRAQLDRKAVAGNKIAALLGIAPARVTEMRKGTRRIQQDEMEPLARFLGMTEEIQVEPEEAEVISIWSRIPADRRDQALDVLQTFVGKRP